jgi:hypothetical protein
MNNMKRTLAFVGLTGMSLNACASDGALTAPQTPAAHVVKVNTATVETAKPAPATTSRTFAQETPKPAPAPTFEIAQGECPKGKIAMGIEHPIADKLRQDGLKIAGVTDAAFAGVKGNNDLTVGSGLRCVPNEDYAGVSEMNFRIGVRFTGTSCTSKTETVEEVGGKKTEVQRIYQPQKTIVFEGACARAGNTLTCEASNVSITDGTTNGMSARDAKGDKVAVERIKKLAATCTPAGG